MTAVAIDGPAGAGKTTVAREVSRRLGFEHVDTGGLYRAVALLALRHGVDPQDAEGLSTVVGATSISFATGQVTLDGEDVTALLRAPGVTAIVSRVSAHPQVRSALLQLQREAAADGDIVMEGRDIGTTVLPDAEVKVFLTASLDERARRRQLEMSEGEGHEALREVASAIAQRDAADAARTESPLAAAPDAIVVDSSNLSLDEVVDRVVSIVHEARRG